jgi:putative oxidoreductase
VVTIAEAGLGILLILGISSRLAALLTGVMTLAFAAAMTLVLGVHAPLIYSVFPFSAASFLLASQPPDKLSIDNLRELKSSRKE